MAAYVQHFIEHGGQVTALLAVAAVWFGFTALGAVTGGGAGRLRAFDPLVGWGWLSLVFTVAGVFQAVTFTYLGGVAAILALGAGVLAWRRDAGLVPAGFVKLVVLALPLLVLVSAMRASQWDEFSDWLIIPRYLLETDAFPSKANPFPNAVFTGYPYSWHFVTFLASRAAGHLLENAGALFNVLLLLSFGVVIARLIGMGLDRDADAAPGWTLIVIGGLAATLLNPTFAQKVVLTSYAETASAVATGAAALLGWRIVEALAENRPDAARPLAWQMGAVLALLINLKQATLVLVLLVVLATLFVALREGRVRLVDFLRLLPRIALPALAVYLAWRYHVGRELEARELRLLPFDHWLIVLIPEIVWNMIVVLAKKGYYLALAVLLVGFGVRGFWRSKTPLDRFAAVAAMVFLGYNAFLLFAYVTTFGKFDALRVASYWRYNMHLGPLVVAFTAYAAAMAWRRWAADRWTWGRLGWLPVVLMLAAPFVFAKKLRFDQAPMTVHYRALGAELAGLLKPGETYAVADPAGSGESAIIVSYEVGGRAKQKGFISAFHAERLKMFRSFATNEALDALVVFTVNDGFGPLVGQDLGQDVTYLLRRAEGGDWRIVRTWPQPAAN